MRNFFLTLTILIFFNCFSQNLDNSFGTNGIITTQISATPSEDITTSAIIQPDEKVVLIGVSTSLSTSSFVARTNSDGSLDTTFNSVGYKFLPGIGFEAVYLQPDGKIIVAGQSVVYRLNNDGSLDATFGNNGSTQITLNENLMYIKSIGIVNTKIVLGGYVRINSSNNNFAIVQLNYDGSLDTTFDSDGLNTYHISAGSDEGYSIKIQADNKILLFGQANGSINYDFATIRINSNGSVDTTFGTNGIILTEFNAPNNDYGRNIELQPDGKILVIGGNSNKYAIARYTSNGFLDTTFNGNGKLYLTTSLNIFNSSTQVHFNRPTISYLSSNKILISGTSNNDFNIIKLNYDGSFDGTFGTNGILNYSIDTGDKSSFLLSKASGELITGGSSYNLSTGTNYRVSLLHFSENGVFETSTNFHFSQGSDRVLSIIEQEDEKIIALVESKTGTTNRAFLVRYNVDGSTDNTFGTNGIIDTGLTKPNKLKQQSDGKFIISTLANTTLTRYNTNGSLDTSFGTNGSSNINSLTGSVALIFNLTIASDDSIFLSCILDDTLNSTLSYGLVKINANGSLAIGFGNNGVATTRFNFYNSSEYEYLTDATIQSDGKIIVCGTLKPASNNYTGGIARFNSNGIIDSTFGTNGQVISSIGTITYPINITNVNNDNFIVNSAINDFKSTGVTKYLTNGAIDTTFGINGFQSNSNTEISNFIVMPDGKIIGGGLYNPIDNSQFLLVKLNTDGTEDSNFGTNGNYITPIFNSAAMNTLIQLQNGKLLGVGSNNNGNSTVGTLARYTDLNLATTTFENEIQPISAYPNPFYDSINIGYELENDDIVTIELVDLQGKIIQTIINKQKQYKGKHSQPINISNQIEYGNYLLNYTTSNTHKSIKVIKIK